MLSGSAKRPRLSKSASEDDEEDDENVMLFSQRLSRFKRPSVKEGENTTHAITSLLNARFQGKSRSMASDDDDFIVPDDSDEETHSTKSGKSSRRSSSQHLTASEDEETRLDEDDLDLDDGVPKKSTSKGKTKAKGGGPVRGVSKKTISTSGVEGVAGSFTFLTAAEQREQGRKEGKKATEEPYAFLQDVRDVSNNSYGNHCIEFWTMTTFRGTGDVQTTLATIREPCISLQRHGNLLLLLRNRQVPFSR